MKGNYRLLFEDNLQPMWASDPETLAFLDVNEAAVRHYGYSKEEFLSMTVGEIHPPENALAVKRPFAGIDRTGPVRHLKKDGTPIWVWLSRHRCLIEESPADLTVAYDVTEARLAEEARRESARRIEAAFERAAIGMAEDAPDGTILRVNEAFCAVLGYPREELVGRNFAEFTHPEDLDENREHVRRLVSGEVESFSMEKRYVRRDGSLFWGKVSGSVVRDTSGGTSSFIAVVEDIGERKRAEEALKESEERFRLMAENARDLITLVDPGGRIVYASPSHEEVLGYTPAELLGGTPGELTHPEDLAELRGSGDTDFVVRARRADGSWVWLEGSSCTVLWRGRPHVVGIARDITGRRRAEEEIRRLNEGLEREVRERTAELEQEKRILDLVANGLSEGVLAVDPRGRIAFSNPAARRLLGAGRARPGDMVPNPWEDLDLPRAVVHCSEGRDRIVARAGGARRPLRVCAEPLPGLDERGAGVLVVLQDLSEASRLEAEQQRFLANAAHEIKTPLTAILGAAELLSEYEAEPEARHRLVSLILDEAGRMRRLSETMLRLARVGIDLREPDLRTVDLEGVARRAVRSVVPLARGRELTVATEGPGGPAYCDEDWLEEALLILLSNATKYSGRGGRVRVRVEGGAITVEDEGVGISEEDLPHVLERFYQGKGASGGFGLGLAICKGLVEGMGGKLSVCSREGGGTRARIELPEEGEDA